MLPEWVELWTQYCARLADAMSKLPPGLSLLAYLYSRIGAYAGTCVRGLQRWSMLGHVSGFPGKALPRSRHQPHARSSLRDTQRRPGIETSRTYMCNEHFYAVALTKTSDFDARPRHGV
jgi:hypothetical protein